MALTEEPAVLVQEVVYAGLDALRAVAAIDLCAYLHHVVDSGPQLYLRCPELAQLEPSHAFGLFNDLRGALDTATVDDRLTELAGFRAVSVLTAGPVSRGLHVVGRRHTPLDERERYVVSRLCHAVGVASHALEAGARPGAETSPLRVGVEVVNGSAHAEVVVPLSSGLRQGLADATSPVDAVALAAIDAIAPSLELAEATDGEIAGKRAVIVLLRGRDGASAVGAALSEPDHLHAAAVATMEAAHRLSADRF